jgi:large subunit ribosomal protein L23
MKTTDVIRRPLVTEKTTVARETTNEVIVFEVARDATKIDIRRAVEKLFGAKVANVRTQIMHGKIKRQGRFAGPRPDWKKAWVRLKAGEKVPEFIEGT